MELMPWRPFGNEVGTLRMEMDDLWNRFFGKTSIARRDMGWSFSVDISDDKDNYIVKAELPGMEAGDINVSLTGNVLTIKGEKKKEEEKKESDHFYSERYYGSFQRSFQLPTDVKADKIDASFKKGVLNITIPKVEEAKKKAIEVKVT